MSIENIQKTDAECGTIAGMDDMQDSIAVALDAQRANNDQ